MTKTISIIMAAVIIFTVNISAEAVYASAYPTRQITMSAKASAHKKTRKKKKKHRHVMPKGNMGKWFKSKKALKKHVAKTMKYWADLEESGKITREEYYEKCPYGYEAWRCSCGKWSGNFKYNKVKKVNINYYIKYAKSYAKEIGLDYDKTATDCWDNPITITTTNKKSAERDIKSRLNRYKNLEGFEAICVWAEKDGSKYRLFIGYC